MAGFKIFSGTSHPELAKRVVGELKIPLGNIEIKRFASHEIYVRIGESVRGHHVYVVQTATASVNEDYMELFLMCDALKRSFAKSVHVILPYYGYSRQDRVAEPREALSARLIADLLMQAGADHLLTFTLHSDQIQGFFRRQMDNVNARKLFVDYFKKKRLKNAVVVSPDTGGAKEAKRFSDELGFPMAILNKVRSAHNVSEVTHVVGDVKGRIPILYDDIIDTAGSVVNAKKALLQAGSSKDVYLVATHPVLSGEAVKRLNVAAFQEVVVTDSIPLGGKKVERIKVLSLSSFIADIIRRVHSDRSVTEIIRSPR